MYHQIFSIQKKLTVLALGLLLPVLGFTQSGDPMFDRLEQMMLRMQEQMQQGMAFDTTFEGGRMQFSPDSSSFFYFRMDTSFNNLGSDFFNLDISPLQDRGQLDMFNLDQLMERFFNGADPFMPRQDYGDMPADDGQNNGTGEDLLPEERLRLQEEQGQTGKTPQPEKKPARSKVKTIRI